MQQLDRLKTKFARDRGRPLRDVASRTWRYIAARLTSAVYLSACDSVGRGSRTTHRPQIDNAGSMCIGERANIASQFSPVQLVTSRSGRIDVGRDAVINFGTRLDAACSITVGDRVSFGPYVQITDHEDSGDSLPVAIGDDVWLAARVRVRPGVTIGAGTVVRAGSVVATSLPGGVIAGGNPAVVLRPRPEWHGRENPDTSAQGKRSAVHRLVHTVGEAIERAVTRRRLRAATSLGADANAVGAPYTRNHGTLVIGKSFRLSSMPVQSHLVVGRGATITIGDRTAIGAGAAIASDEHISIGSDVTIGEGVMIMDTDFHDIRDMSRRGTTAPVIIEDGVSIGRGVVILKGTHVTKNTRIPAGAVVARGEAR